MNRNFPFSMITRKVSPALAAGCPVRLFHYSVVQTGADADGIAKMARRSF